MEILRRFNDDTQTKEALFEYLKGFFMDKIIERALKKESTDSLADAILELENGFRQLDIDYGIQKKQSGHSNNAK